TASSVCSWLSLPDSCANAGATNMGFPCQNLVGHAVLRSRPFRLLVLDGEEQEQSNQQREDAESFSHREAENQAAELAVSSCRVAQSAREVATEDVAEAECRTSHAKASKTCADVTCCFRFHVKLLLISRLRFLRAAGPPVKGMISGSGE